MEGDAVTTQRPFHNVDFLINNFQAEEARLAYWTIHELGGRNESNLCRGLPTLENIHFSSVYNKYSFSLSILFRLYGHFVATIRDDKRRLWYNNWLEERGFSRRGRAGIRKMNNVLFGNLAGRVIVRTYDEKIERTEIL